MPIVAAAKNTISTIPLPTAIALLCLVLGAIGSLVALVWKQHSQRVDAIDRRVDKNRDEARADIATIHKKLDDANQGIGGLAAGIHGLRADIAGHYVSKDDCDQCREDG